MGTLRLLRPGKPVTKVKTYSTFLPAIPQLQPCKYHLLHPPAPLCLCVQQISKIFFSKLPVNSFCYLSSQPQSNQQAPTRQAYERSRKASETDRKISDLFSPPNLISQVNLKKFTQHINCHIFTSLFVTISRILKKSWWNSLTTYLLLIPQHCLPNVVQFLSDRFQYLETHFTWTLSQANLLRYQNYLLGSTQLQHPLRTVKKTNAKEQNIQLGKISSALFY